jgi:hypothetical protein
MSIISPICGIGSVSSSIPKSLENFARQRALSVEILKFRGYGKTYKGYALVDSQDNEIVELEPTNFKYDENKWQISIKGRASEGYRGQLIYAKTISEAVKKMERSDVAPRNTGFKFKRK